MWPLMISSEPDPGILKAMRVCGRPHLRSNSCFAFCETHYVTEKDEWNFLQELTVNAPGGMDFRGDFL